MVLSEFVFSGTELYWSNPCQPQLYSRVLRYRSKLVPEKNARTVPVRTVKYLTSCNFFFSLDKNNSTEKKYTIVLIQKNPTYSLSLESDYYSFNQSFILPVLVRITGTTAPYQVPVLIKRQKIVFSNWFSM